ncbi:hypothetical protein VNO80_00986 [Phaseolus coccineus]|uniref:Uncharacterized protein n=1 Tax=Phaseolus coccineus TaxID=3886 RepID=A0AAN9RR01_PHACN
MTKNFSSPNDMLDTFKDRALQRRDRPSIEALAIGATTRLESTVGADPSNSKRKRQRKGGNMAQTTRSLGTMSIPPPSHSGTIDVNSPSTDDFHKPIPSRVVETTMEVIRLKKVVKEAGHENSIFQAENVRLKREKEKVEVELGSLKILWSC